MVLVLTDISRNYSSSSSSSNPLLGDVFCVLSSLLYALSNIGCEVLLKVGQPHDEEEAETKVSEALARNHNVELSPLVLSQEYLAMMSMWTVGVSGIQCLALEFDRLRATNFTAATVAYLEGFICVMFIIYTCVPLFIAYSSSTYFNLSLLCSDGYSLVFSVFLLGFVITGSFLLAYTLIIVGLATYHTPPSFDAGDDLRHTEAPTDGESSTTDGGAQSAPLRATDFSFGTFDCAHSVPPDLVCWSKRKALGEDAKLTASLQLLGKAIVLVVPILLYLFR